MQTEYNYFATFATPFCFLGGILSAALCAMALVDFYQWLKQGPNKPKKKGCAQ